MKNLLKILFASLIVLFCLPAIGTAQSSSEVINNLRDVTKMRRFNLNQSRIEISAVDVEGNRHHLVGTIAEQFFHECWTSVTNFMFATQASKRLTLTVTGAAIAGHLSDDGKFDFTYFLDRNQGDDISNCQIKK